MDNTNRKDRSASFFSVYVGNLNSEVTEDDLDTLFSECGHVAEKVIIPPKEQGRSKFGFVRYHTQEEALRAIKELNGWSLKSQRIVVDIASDCAHKLKLAPHNMQPDESYCELINAAAFTKRSGEYDSVLNLNRVKETCLWVSSEFFGTDSGGVNYTERVLYDLQRKTRGSLVPAPPHQSASTETILEKAMSWLQERESEALLQKYKEVYEKFNDILKDVKKYTHTGVSDIQPQDDTSPQKISVEEAINLEPKCTSPQKISVEEAINLEPKCTSPQKKSVEEAINLEPKCTSPQKISVEEAINLEPKCTSPQKISVEEAINLEPKCTSPQKKSVEEAINLEPKCTSPQKISVEEAINLERKCTSPQKKSVEEAINLGPKYTSPQKMSAGAINLELKCTSPQKISVEEAINLEPKCTSPQKISVEEAINLGPKYTSPQKMSAGAINLEPKYTSPQKISVEATSINLEPKCTSPQKMSVETTNANLEPKCTSPQQKFVEATNLPPQGNTSPKKPISPPRKDAPATYLNVENGRPLIKNSAVKEINEQEGMPAPAKINPLVRKPLPTLYKTPPPPVEPPQNSLLPTPEPPVVRKKNLFSIPLFPSKKFTAPLLPDPSPLDKTSMAHQQDKVVEDSSGAEDSELRLHGTLLEWGRHLKNLVDDDSDLEEETIVTSDKKSWEENKVENEWVDEKESYDSSFLSDLFCQVLESDKPCVTNKRSPVSCKVMPGGGGAEKTQKTTKSNPVASKLLQDGDGVDKPCMTNKRSPVACKLVPDGGGDNLVPVSQASHGDADVSVGPKDVDQTMSVDDETLSSGVKVSKLAMLAKKFSQLNQPTIRPPFFVPGRAKPL
ncbi:titin-like [Physella acuta]|uniref:titin-like n=1 Tax=Physella acuta TaxID=109671 RepID=UPI0027DB5764|nr:titin-like [Physella acuta]